MTVNVVQKMSLAQQLIWVDGGTLRIEYRHAEGNSARMQAFAKELVELKPEWLIGDSTPVVTALVHATRTIPIVFVSVSDRIGSGFVATMAARAATSLGSPSCKQASQEICLKTSCRSSP